MRFLAVFLLMSSLAVILPSAHAQVQIQGTNLTVTPVNGGTGTLVSIPIPGGSGLSITVGQGSAALPLQNINNMTDSTLLQLGDDGWRDIPLPFQFPYWGQTFNQSTMYSNGVVQFGRPVGNNWPSWNNAFCCHGEDLRNSTNTGHNYSIMPLWTDLIDTTGQTAYYRGTSTSMTYGWYGIRQYGNRNASNTFEVDINNTGAFNVRYGGIFISPTQYTTIGMTGDLSKGEYVQLYNGLGLPQSSEPWSWSALNGTGAVDQCIINPLYSPSCAGYASAYLSQQCSISALYDPSCPGYASAYYNQQCSINPLYDLNCPGYASAYLEYQCSVNPLYSTTCSGYQQAYFNQQCELNGLYSQQCPNYATAYATKMLLEQQGTASIVATAGVIAQTAPTTTTVSSDGTVSSPTSISSTGNTTVDKAITPTTTTTNSAAAPAAPVQLVQSPPAATAPAAPSRQEQRSEDRKDDAQKGTGGSSPSQNTGNATASSDKPAAPTARQALQERREAAAKAEAVEKGKNLANEMGKADNMEQQKQIQNVVIQAMGFTPGFDAYSTQIIVQQPFYKPYQVYGNQKTIDNRANQRMFSGTDNLHNEMVESQYRTYGK